VPVTFVLPVVYGAEISGQGRDPSIYSWSGP
jgi:hypothetical protein